MAAENILALLAGRDSKNPMGFDELFVAGGMDAAVLESVLQQLCHKLPAPINCAQITRAGKTQMFYWPTGVVEKAERQDITINPKKRPTFPAPRRSEIMPAKPKQETPMQAKDGKSNARVMLEYLAEHHTATGQELCQMCGVESVGSYLIGPIKRKHLNVERLGPTQRSGNRYTVASGVTREMLLRDARQKNVPPHVYKEMQAETAAEESTVSGLAPASDEGAKDMSAPEASLAQPSNVLEFKPPPIVPTPAELGELPALDRFCYCHNVFIDGNGQLVIQQPGRLHIVFPPPDTIRIQKLLLAIDLESLCD